MSWWTQAWRSLWRDARAGELRLLVVAVVLGLAGLSSVGFWPTAFRPACNAMPRNCSAVTW